MVVVVAMVSSDYPLLPRQTDGDEDWRVGWCTGVCVCVLIGASVLRLCLCLLGVLGVCFLVFLHEGKVGVR